MEFVKLEVRWADQDIYKYYEKSSEFGKITKIRIVDILCGGNLGLMFYSLSHMNAKKVIWSH